MSPYRTPAPPPQPETPKISFWERVLHDAGHLLGFYPHALNWKDRDVIGVWEIRCTVCGRIEVFPRKRPR